jgi:hypothetical protein
MGRDPRNTGGSRVALQELPNDLLAEGRALYLAAAVHGPENLAIRDAGRGCPRVDSDLNPFRYRHRPDTAVLSDEVHNAPSPVALLDVPLGERRHFRPPKPQPRSTARIARSRRPLGVVAFGAFRNFCACWTESQFPSRMPLDATPFTRVIPVASSGASSPLSAASTANFRTAVIRRLTETAPSPRASRATRQALTVAFVEPGRGSRVNHAENSSRPRLYARRVIGEETLSSTSDFNRRHSEARSANTK